jgi:hypothetical protein
MPSVSVLWYWSNFCVRAETSDLKTAVTQYEQFRTDVVPLIGDSLRLNGTFLDYRIRGSKNGRKED